MVKAVRSMGEFYARYMPESAMQEKEALKLKTVKVCSKCDSRNITWVKHKTHGYYLCYGCGWSSMSPREIGAAIAKEVLAKLELHL